MFYLNRDEPSHLGGPSPSLSGWVYLAYDYRDLHYTKIGITTRPIHERIRQTTTNAWYALFCAFHIPAERMDLEEIERYICWKLHVRFVPHLSGRESEWCAASPSDVLSMVVGKLPNVVSIDFDDGEFDFTRTIYLPQVDVYSAQIDREKLEEYVRFAAPATYLEELRLGYRRWDARPDFAAEVARMGSRTPLAISGPQLLMDRINYDIVRRRLA